MLLYLQKFILICIVTEEFPQEPWLNLTFWIDSFQLFL